jgi:hypothetical protein
MMDHEILHMQSCHEELQQQLAPEQATEWVQLGFVLQCIREHAQWFTEPIVTEISQTGLLYGRAEESVRVQTYPASQRRESSVQGPDGPREPRASEVVNAVPSRHYHASLQQ